jgi:hypothetical protein
MTSAERAVQIWQVLIGAAHHRQTITYEELTKLIGMGDKGFVIAGKKGPLGRVAWYCERKGYPPLTCLVVGRNTGRPGTEFSDLDVQREKVFEKPWYNLPPVPVAEFTPWGE